MVNELLEEGIFELAVAPNWSVPAKYKTEEVITKNVPVYVNIITIN